MHLNKKIIKISIIIFTLFMFSSCEKKEEVKFVAKVGNNYLTEEEVDQVISSSLADSSFYREVYIRQWIEEQLLFLAATDKGILNSEEFRSIVKMSEKKTANSILIKEILSNVNLSTDSASVKKYFNEHESEFKLTQPAILYNFASFKNFHEAENFRSSLFYKSWQDAVANSHTILQSSEEIFLYIVQKSPDIYKQVYNSLIENQISNVIPTTDGLYLVFLLLKKFDKNDIPDLKTIYEMVKERFIAQQRETVYKKYIKELYSNYSKKIER